MYKVYGVDFLIICTGNTLSAERLESLRMVMKIDSLRLLTLHYIMSKVK